MLKEGILFKTFSPKPIRGLSRPEAAEYVGVGTTLFDQLILQGKMPEGRKIAGRKIWDIRQLDRAMDDLFEMHVDAFASYGQPHV
jgi:hypothetical protein